MGYLPWNMILEEPEDTEKSREWIAGIIGKPEQILKSKGLNVSHVIRWGDAANMILEEAGDWQADAIFIGARGLGGVKRFLLGSVSSAVAARAHCSVEVIR
jgi:nucleotide-binding universal stress UspA family protein